MANIEQIYHAAMRLDAPQLPMDQFNNRIKAGMLQHWPDSKTTTLIREWVKKYGTRRTPSRPTFYDWFNAKTPKIDIPNLYLLSDLLDVNARWLALGPPIPITKPFIPDPEIMVLIDAYHALPHELRDELTKEAHKLLRLQKYTSKAKPFR